MTKALEQAGNANASTKVPKNTPIDMPSLLEQTIADEGAVLMYPIHEYWLDIGRMSDFSQAQIDIHTLGMLHD